ncbi:hypothetical protein IA57_07505 [Mangrovimonas yunxiaonensis]|uniref:Oligosaccharide repeat unit polymerase n=1 Tax=Mangrovimonas yunxiaonensis TaxID=1197477 RepID=A0A084TLS9_9FLAO|nr:O-antigen polymerase [Mangrovimonas yunxiaonensis]KFB01665.1 hypothetical protein IA57_07505 [Mangrovimonas yunxiaonensis]GGH35342.1 hypothetical protein GCM10011364_01830 [Mangrovimonas yunxiaonensis]
MDDKLFLLNLFNVLTLLGIISLYKYRIANPLFYYFFFNWIMVFGCFNFLDFNIEADYIHALLISMTPLYLLIGYLLGNLGELKGSYKKYLLTDIKLKPNKSVLLYAKILFVISIFMSLLYYHLVGYNLMFLSLTSKVDDFVTMRLEAYSGNNYYAPGIFNQFKNTIFPILFFFFYFLNKNKKWISFYLILIGPILIYSIAGTGQRTFLILCSIIGFFIFSTLNKGKIPKKNMIAGTIVILAFFSFLSVNLKRSESTSFNDTFSQLFYRILDSNQYSAVIAFRYVYDKDIQYGGEWLTSFLGLIPGVKGSDLSNQIFNVIFGGTRGTSPPSVWGSAYHNFGFIGCIITGILIGFIYTKLYKRFLNGDLNVLRICGYAGIFAYLASWISGTPSQLLNNGVLGCMLILYVAKVFKRKYG